jgi:hypothetical protein
MAQYKLILEYPSSPEKGSIVYSGHRERAYSDLKYKLKNGRNIKNYIFFDADLIEKFPKFWKKTL